MSDFHSLFLIILPIRKHGVFYFKKFIGNGKPCNLKYTVRNAFHVFARFCNCKPTVVNQMGKSCVCLDKINKLRVGVKAVSLVLKMTSPKTEYGIPVGCLCFSKSPSYFLRTVRVSINYNN